MFFIRTINLESADVDVASFDLTPSNEEGQMVCSLFAEFLSSRTAEFRERLPFLKKGDYELEWAVAPGGVALASFFESQAPQSTGILLCGLNAEADGLMLEMFRQAVLEPLLPGDAEGIERCIAAPERPLLLHILFPGEPEFGPTLQLLSAALASVFFRCMLELASEEDV